MTNICLNISYDGTNYSGFQIQAGNIATVQGVLEAALGRIYKQPVRVAGAGRTDAGVHALGQVISYEAPFIIPIERLPEAVNSLLPPEVVVWKAEEKWPGFHARFSARKKTYSYAIDRARYPQIMRRRFSWHYPWELDVGIISKGGALFVGRHDFAVFRAGKNITGSSVRTLYRVSVECLDDRQFLKIILEGNGFLYKMARLMVGSLVRLGRGQIRMGDLEKALAEGERGAAGPAAPARGLCLERVEY